MLAGLAINNRRVLLREAKAMLKDTVKETLQGVRLMIATDKSGADLNRNVAAEEAQG